MCLAPHCECNGRSATCQRHDALAPVASLDSTTLATCLCRRTMMAMYCRLTNLRLHSRAQLGARGLSSALAGWRAFDGPSSAAGLSDTRICAGGLAGFLTGWPGLPRFASGSTDQRMWRTIDRAIADSSRDFCPFCATPAAPPGAAANRRGGCQRARLSGFQPVLLRQKPGRGTAGFLEDRLPATALYWWFLAHSALKDVHDRQGSGYNGRIRLCIYLTLHEG